MFMTKDKREIQRRLRILRYAEETGPVAKTCRYFGIGQTSFYRWRKDFAERGVAGLINAPPIPKRHANRTPAPLEEKVLHLRRKYHLGPMRIVWYLERYHDIQMSDSTVSRILRRNGMNRLPRGTRMRKVHTKRYNKQVPGHHIQMDVKFLTFIGKKGEKIRRFQYTAIDDATRVRALKIYEKHTQANAIDFVDHVIEKFPFRIKEIRTDNTSRGLRRIHLPVSGS
jgi:transposase